MGIRSGVALIAALVSAVTADKSWAGVVDNALNAASLQTAAAMLLPGDYVFTNVGTGKSLKYDPKGNHIYPADKGDASPISILHFGGDVSWVRLEMGDKSKCLSSQWGGSYDHAAVAYECAVDKGNKLRKGSTLEPTKQWWITVPVDDHVGDKHDKEVVQFLAKAQKQSVNIREGANRRKAGSGHRLTKRARIVKHRRKSKKAAPKNRAAKLLDLNIASFAAKARKPKKAYFIIPSDHLIDMRTMALTAQSMKTFGNAVSTALTPFDPKNKYQQWVLTRVDED